MALGKNVGSMDKTIRIVLGVILAAFGILGAGLSSAIGIAALVAGAVLIVTGLVNFCPVFRMLGINSIRG